MSNYPFRLVEKEYRSNFTSRVKAIDYDSRYYLNDKDAPAEDTLATDWAPDPTKLFTGCEPDYIIYSLDLYYDSTHNPTTYAPTPPQNPYRTDAMPWNTQLPPGTSQSYDRQYLLGGKTPFHGVTYSVDQVGQLGTSGMWVAMNDAYLLGIGVPAWYDYAGALRSQAVLQNGIMRSHFPSIYVDCPQSGTVTWNTPTNWQKGLASLYNPNHTASFSSTDVPKDAWRSHPEIPNHMNYYWLFTHRWNFKSMASGGGPTYVRPVLSPFPNGLTIIP